MKTNGMERLVAAILPEGTKIKTLSLIICFNLLVADFFHFQYFNPIESLSLFEYYEKYSDEGNINIF